MGGNSSLLLVPSVSLCSFTSTYSTLHLHLTHSLITLHLERVYALLVYFVLYHMLIHGMMVLYCTAWDIILNKHGMGIWDMLVAWYNMGKNTVCGMVYVDGMVREKHSIWYGTFVVWYHGTVSWMYSMAKLAWW